MPGITDELPVFFELPQDMTVSDAKSIHGTKDLYRMMNILIGAK